LNTNFFFALKNGNITNFIRIATFNGKDVEMTEEMWVDLSYASVMLEVYNHFREIADCVEGLNGSMKGCVIAKQAVTMAKQYISDSDWSNCMDTPDAYPTRMFQFFEHSLEFFTQGFCMDSEVSLENLEIRDDASEGSDVTVPTQPDTSGDEIDDDERFGATGLNG